MPQKVITEANRLLHRREGIYTPEIIFYDPKTGMFTEKPTNHGVYDAYIKNRSGILMFQVEVTTESGVVKMNPVEVIGRGANGAVFKAYYYSKPDSPMPEAQEVLVKTVVTEHQKKAEVQREMTTNQTLGMGHDALELRRFDNNRVYFFQQIEDRGERVTKSKVDALSMDEQLQAAISMLREFSAMHSGEMAARASSSGVNCPYVHCDIHSGNILMSRDSNGTILILAIDFGDAVPYTGKEKQEGHFGTLQFLPVHSDLLLAYADKPVDRRHRVNLLRASVGVDSMLADKIACLRTIIHPVQLAGGSLCEVTDEGEEQGFTYLLSPENFKKLPKNLRELLDTTGINPKDAPEISLPFIASALAAFRINNEELSALRLAVIKSSKALQQQILSIMDKFDKSRRSDDKLNCIHLLTRAIRQTLAQYHYNLLKDESLSKAIKFYNKVAKEDEGMSASVELAFYAVVQNCPELSYDLLHWLNSNDESVTQIIIAFLSESSDKHDIITQWVEFARYTYALDQLTNFIGEILKQNIPEEVRKTLMQQLVVIDSKRTSCRDGKFKFETLAEVPDYLEHILDNLKTQLQELKNEPLLSELERLHNNIFPKDHTPHFDTIHQLN